MANLGNKNLILQVLLVYFGHFGVETRKVDLRQGGPKKFVELIRDQIVEANRQKLYLKK